MGRSKGVCVCSAGCTAHQPCAKRATARPAHRLETSKREGSAAHLHPPCLHPAAWPAGSALAPPCGGWPAPPRTQTGTRAQPAEQRGRHGQLFQARKQAQGWEERRARSWVRWRAAQAQAVDNVVQHRQRKTVKLKQRSRNSPLPPSSSAPHPTASAAPREPPVATAAQGGAIQKQLAYHMRMPVGR